MKKLLFVSGFLCVLTGCDIPYKKEYEMAKQAKATIEKNAAEVRAAAEQIRNEAQKKVAEAQIAKEKAERALSDEQNAIRRLYTEK